MFPSPVISVHDEQLNLITVQFSLLPMQQGPPSRTVPGVFDNEAHDLQSSRLYLFIGDFRRRGSGGRDCASVECRDSWQRLLRNPSGVTRTRGAVLQGAERRSKPPTVSAVNRRVVGSSPTCGAKNTEQNKKKGYRAR